MTKGLSSVPLTDLKPALSIKDRVNIEQQLLLPDYCPDICRVIFVDCRTAVTGVSCSQNEVSVSGLSFLNLCYEAEGCFIKKTEYSVPFRKVYQLKESLAEPICRFKACSCSVSFKLISRRRLDVRGSFCLEGNVFDIKELNVLEKSDTLDIILKQEKLSYLSPYDSINEILSLTEELLPPQNKPFAEEILQAEIKPVCESCRYSDKSLKLKGSILLHTLYTPKDMPDTIESFDTILPLEKEWENINLDEGFLIDATLTPLTISLSKSEDVIKEDGKLLFEGEISCLLSIFAPFEKNIAADGFSPSFQYEKKTESPRVLKSILPFSSKEKAEGEIPASGDIREIQSCFAAVKNISIIDEEAKKCFCDVEFMMLYKNADGKYGSFSHILRCSSLLQQAEKSDFVKADAIIEAPFASLSNGKLKLCCDVNLNGLIFKGENKCMLTDVELDEEKKIQKTSDFSMVIYYADENDDLWSIGKKYKVDPVKLKEENALEEDTFKERTPLIIPL